MKKERLIKCAVFVSLLIPGAISAQTDNEIASKPYYCEKLVMLAERGNPIAQNNLGVCYSRGINVEKNDSLAYVWYKKGADNGDGAAMSNLGDFYLSGRFVKKDMKEAARLFEASSEKNRAEGTTNLGLMYLKGQYFQRDPQKAFELFCKAVKDHERHIFHYNHKIYALVGRCYQDGIGTEKNMDQALKYYKIAANNGFLDAYGMLGSLYENGTGVAKDYAAAENWYKQGAAKNNGYCLYVLGTNYLKGDKFAKNTVAGIKHLQGAVGDKELSPVLKADAIRQIADVLRYGKGVKANVAAAEKLEKLLKKFPVPTQADIAKALAFD